jgi:hypothetical protein
LIRERRKVRYPILDEGLWIRRTSCRCDHAKAQTAAKLFRRLEHDHLGLSRSTRASALAASSVSLGDMRLLIDRRPGLSSKIEEPTCPDFVALGVFDDADHGVHSLNIGVNEP